MLINAEHDRAYRRLDLMKLRSVKKIGQSLVKRTISQFEGFAIRSRRDSITRCREEIQKPQENGLSAKEELGRIGARLLQFFSDQSLLMEDIESIPLDRDKYRKWEHLNSEKKEIEHELMRISELPGVDGRPF